MSRFYNEKCQRNDKKNGKLQYHSEKKCRKYICLSNPLSKKHNGLNGIVKLMLYLVQYTFQIC